MFFFNDIIGVGVMWDSDVGIGEGVEWSEVTLLLLWSVPLSWWRDWGRHSLNTAQSSVAQWPAHTSLITTPGQAETLQETPGSEREREQ